MSDRRSVSVKPEVTRWNEKRLEEWSADRIADSRCSCGIAPFAEELAEMPAPSTNQCQIPWDFEKSSYDSSFFDSSFIADKIERADLELMLSDMQKQRCYKLRDPCCSWNIFGLGLLVLVSALVAGNISGRQELNKNHPEMILLIVIVSFAGFCLCIYGLWSGLRKIGVERKQRAATLRSWLMEYTEKHFEAKGVSVGTSRFGSYLIVKLCHKIEIDPAKSSDDLSADENDIKIKSVDYVVRPPIQREVVEDKHVEVAMSTNDLDCNEVERKDLQEKL